jgi:hypothetical protein
MIQIERKFVVENARSIVRSKGVLAFVALLMASRGQS